MQADKFVAFEWSVGKLHFTVGLLTYITQMYRLQRSIVV